MKKKLWCYLVLLVSFFIGLKNYQAKVDMTFQELYTKLGERIPEVNEESVCYNSNIRKEDNIIYISYENKDASSSCPDAGDWYMKLENKDYLLFDSYYGKFIIEEDIDLTKLLEQDILWFNKFLEIVEVSYTFDELKTKADNLITFLKDEELYCYIQEYRFTYSDVYEDGIAASSTHLLEYIRGFRYLLNNDVWEVKEVTSNSIQLKHNQYATSHTTCYGEGCGYSLVDISTDNENFESSTFDYSTRIISNLKPNTTYYLKINDNLYGTQYLTVKTLADTTSNNKTSETGEDIIPKNETIDNTKETNDNPVKNNDDEIENPKTGITIISVSIIFLALAIILIIKHKKDVIHKI